MQHVQYVMQPDGTRQAVVMQPDGTQQPVMVQPDATQEQQVFLQPDGTQIVIQPDGSQLIMPPAGMPPAGMQEQHIVQDQTTGAHYMVSGGGQQVAGLQQQYAVPQQQQQEQQQPPPSYLHVKSEAPPPIVPPPSIFARPFFEQGSPTPKFWILLGAVLLIALAIGKLLALLRCWFNFLIRCAKPCAVVFLLQASGLVWEPGRRIVIRPILYFAITANPLATKSLTIVKHTTAVRLWTGRVPTFWLVPRNIVKSLYV